MKIILIFISFLFLSSMLIAGNAEQLWNFDQETGPIPAGFTSEKGEWKIAADSTAPSPPKVLAQSARNSGSTFNLILVQGTNYKNVDLSVLMKAVAGKEDQGGGLVWRAEDPQNYFVARFNPLEDNYRLYKVEQGKRIQLQSADVKYSAGWHILRVIMEGDRIQCYYDGRKVLEARDQTFPGPGKIGLWTKADAQTHFDNLKLIGK
jgi:hypothetical protein